MSRGGCVAGADHVFLMVPLHLFLSHYLCDAVQMKEEIYEVMLDLLEQQRLPILALAEAAASCVLDRGYQP